MTDGYYVVSFKNGAWEQCEYVEDKVDAHIMCASHLMRGINSTVMRTDEYELYKDRERK